MDSLKSLALGSYFIEQSGAQKLGTLPNKKTFIFRYQRVFLTFGQIFDLLFLSRREKIKHHNMIHYKQNMTQAWANCTIDAIKYASCTSLQAK